MLCFVVAPFRLNDDDDAVESGPLHFDFDMLVDEDLGVATWSSLK